MITASVNYNGIVTITLLDRGWVKSQEEITVSQLEASLKIPPLAPLDELVRMAREAMRQ